MVLDNLSCNCTFATVFGVIRLHTITVQCMLLRTESIEFLLLLPENPFFFVAVYSVNVYGRPLLLRRF